MDIIKFKMGALEKKGVVIKLLWLVVLKICFEKLATTLHLALTSSRVLSFSLL